MSFNDQNETKEPMSPLSEEVSKSIEENTDEKIETTSLEKPVEEKPLEEKAEDDMLSLWMNI